ncbi:efflux RND transporter periplasmic adaptor subunit [Mangrovihabitans endophyticus]|uniref:HlyD family secretion protein n=1 Tax=Mangrovihabitans endophyticus TaxID=1751298 RepID=A0A8J3C6L6_9ACTN|nr:HlyD family efflux transporter periplasmic adaptor subunit [Mangrovihabitans endophyticus]GGL16666.1 hypothetical protein GCM10012284_59080 [Mangrovihabitans endophyticus]
MSEMRPVRRRLRWAAAAVVVAGLVAAGVTRALTAGAEPSPAAPATVAVDRGTVTAQVATTGTVQPAQTRSLSFTVSGTVKDVKVRPGQMVAPGEDLAAVDDTGAAAAVDAARQTLDDAEDQLTAARAAAEQEPDAGDGCTGADVPAGYATTHGPSGAATPPTPATPAATTPASRPASARPTTTAPATAPASPAPSPSAATAGTSTTVAGKAQQKTGRQDGVPGQTGQTGQSCTGDRQNEQGGQNGQAGGSDAILSAQQRVTQAGVALADAEDALAGATITAPIRGRILAVAGKVGSQVSGGGTFVTLADVYDMQVSAAFPEADADRLAVRQKATVTLTAAGADAAALGATVVQVDPVGSSDGTMVRYGVVLSFTQAPEDLLVGQSAAVRVTTGEKSGVLRVPSAAVHDVTGDRGTVLCAGARTQVGVGLRGDRYTEITSGLAEGATVTRSW